MSSSAKRSRDVSRIDGLTVTLTKSNSIVRVLDLFPLGLFPPSCVRGCVCIPGFCADVHYDLHNSRVDEDRAGLHSYVVVAWYSLSPKRRKQRPPGMLSRDSKAEAAGGADGKTKPSHPPAVHCSSIHPSSAQFSMRHGAWSDLSETSRPAVEPGSTHRAVGIWKGTWCMKLHQTMNAHAVTQSASDR